MGSPHVTPRPRTLDCSCSAWLSSTVDLRSSPAWRQGGLTACSCSAYSPSPRPGWRGWVRSQVRTAAWRFLPRNDQPGKHRLRLPLQGGKLLAEASMSLFMTRELENGVRNKGNSYRPTREIVLLCRGALRRPPGRLMFDRDRTSRPVSRLGPRAARSVSRVAVSRDTRASRVSSDRSRAVRVARGSARPHRERDSHGHNASAGARIFLRMRCPGYALP